MKRMKDYGGQATCTQLSVKYGESKNFYNSGSLSLAKRVAGKTGCEVPPDRDSGNASWCQFSMSVKMPEKKMKAVISGGSEASLRRRWNSLI